MGESSLGVPSPETIIFLQQTHKSLSIKDVSHRTDYLLARPRDKDLPTDWVGCERLCEVVLRDRVRFRDPPTLSNQDGSLEINENAFNLVLIGDTGLGKSHIASAICYEAILRGYPTACITAFDLVSRIHRAYNPASKIDNYAKVRVLCIDELGYTYHKKEDTDTLFQIISKRNEILPTIVTTNLAPKEWGSIFSATAASAILDRLSFNGRFITFEGRSYRLLKKHKTR